MNQIKQLLVFARDMLRQVEPTFKEGDSAAVILSIRALGYSIAHSISKTGLFTSSDFLQRSDRVKSSSTAFWTKRGAHRISTSCVTFFTLILNTTARHSSRHEQISLTTDAPTMSA